MVRRPHKYKNNCPNDNDQGMQAWSEEAARQTAVEATLQWMKNVYNLRLVVIERAVESLRLFKNEDRERHQQQ